MSLFDDDLFSSDSLGQVALPEPASDALISELRTTGGRTTRTAEPSSTPEVPKETGDKMLSGGSTSALVPYAIVAGGVIFAGLLIWSATRKRPTPNRRRRRNRR